MLFQVELMNLCAFLKIWYKRCVIRLHFVDVEINMKDLWVFHVYVKIC